MWMWMPARGEMFIMSHSSCVLAAKANYGTNQAEILVASVMFHVDIGRETPGICC